MRVNHESEPLVKEKSETVCEFLWGADEIGAAIGRNGRQTHHLLAHGSASADNKALRERAARLGCRLRKRRGSSQKSQVLCAMARHDDDGSAAFAPSRPPTRVKAVYRTRTRRTRWIVARQRRRASRSIPVYVRRSELLLSGVNGGAK